MSIGNLGSCVYPECNVNVAANLRNRKFTKDSSTKVETLTEVLGILDGLGCLVFLSSGFYFAHRWIPATVQSQDEKHVTAADYAISVQGLPRWYKKKGEAKKASDEHTKYQEELKNHFLEVLKLDYDEKTLKEKYNGGVREVALIRDYGGAISKFMAQGVVLKEMDCYEERARQASELGKEKEAETFTFKKQEWEEKAEQMEVELEDQASAKDEDRAVVEAFVMFDTEELKDSVLAKYERSRTGCYRRFQLNHLRFNGAKIKVVQAPEPDELFWENLDYPRKRRIARRYGFWCLTCLLLLTHLVVAGKLTTLPNASAKFAGAKTFVLQSKGTASLDGQCMKICNPQVSDSATCDNFLSLAADNNIYSSCCGTHTVTNSSSATCLAQTLPSTCSNDVQTIVVDYGSLVTPNCLKVVMPREQSSAIKADLDDFKIYGCDEGFTWDVVDEVTKECMEISIEEFKISQDPTSLVDTVNIRLGLHVSCDGGTPSLEKAQAAEAMLGQDDSIEDSRLQCFCKQEYKKQGTFFLLGPFDTEEKKICQKWAEVQASATLRYFLGISLVVIMNSVLWLFITIFDSLSKHKFLSSITNAQMVEIMASQFVNTGVLLLLVSLHTYGLFSNFGFVQDWVGVGPHDDFTTAWHTQNGSSLIVTLGSTIVCALALPILSVWPTVPLFVWFFKKGAVTRKAMDELYLLPQFAFSSRLAASNCVLFVVLMYSGAMPILYLLGCLYFAASYWIDKWAFLRGSARPPAYNQEVVHLSVSIWHLAVFLHVVMVCCMYTPSVFPSDWSWFKDVIFAILDESDKLYDQTLLIWDSSPRAIRSDYYGEWMRGRFADIGRKCCWLQFFILFIFCSIFGAIATYQFVLKPWFNCIDVFQEQYCPCCRKRAEATAENYDCGKKIAEESNSIFSYELKASKLYADAYHALQYDPDRTHYVDEIVHPKSQGFIETLTSRSTRHSRHRVNRNHIEGEGGLIVTIVGAKGLANIDVLTTSDPYCTCAVIGKPESAFKTSVVKNDCNPVWLHEHHVNMRHWNPGDGLKFEVFDHDVIKTEVCLGRAELAYAKFMLEGFDGELVLDEAGEGITATLAVKVEVLGKDATTLDIDVGGATG